MTTVRAQRLIPLVVLAIVACSPAPAPPAAQPTTAPAAAAPVAKAPAAAAPAAGAVKAAPSTWADVFPAGQGKDPVLQVCGTCHGLDRVVLGQKAPDRWESIKNSHSDKAGGLTTQQLNAVFGYLSESFGTDDPEPNIAGLPATAATAE